MKHYLYLKMYLPTAGDIDRELPEPVGEGDGRTPLALGPPTPSLLLHPVISWKKIQSSR